MKMLTICQPYADLILLPDSHPEHKRTENRRWHTSYHGPLLIHAGKSREWMEEDDDRPGHEIYGLRIADIVFGAILGVVEQVACYPVIDIRAGHIPHDWLWLMNHQHVEGPYCHVYQNVRRFAVPIPYKGAQGFCDVPMSVVAASIEEAAVAGKDGK